MKPFFRFMVFSSVFLIFFISCRSDQEHVPLSKHTEKQLAQALGPLLLEVWYPRVVDTLHGGYLSNFSFDWQPFDPQEKMIVTQARHLWMTAKAAQYYQDDRYREMADHGFQFLQEKMWDPEMGGFYTRVDRKGDLIWTHGEKDEKKAYGNAFAIYGLAAHHALTGDEASLALAKETFYWLETHSHDNRHKGYFQDLQRDGTAYGRNYDALTQDQKRLGWKDQNSSIHLLEAFSELYQIWPDPLLKERTLELIQLIRDTITTEKGYMNLFFTPTWEPISFADSSRAYLEEHIHYDHVSFGHDVETAFLLLEACEVIGEEYDITLPKAKKMVDHGIDLGFDHSVGGFYEKGYYFPGTDTLTLLDRRKNWWSQAEGLHSLLLFSTLFPEEPRYRSLFHQQWGYINTFMIDHEHGGWYRNGIDIEPRFKTESKGGIWKSAYHNGRALMRSIELMEGH